MMFDRVEIKENAKKSIKQYYVMGLVACILFAFINGDIFGSIQNFYEYISSLLAHGEAHTQIIFDDARGIILSTRRGFLPEAKPFMTGGISFKSSSGIFAVFAVLFTIFVVNVVEVGLYSYFLKNRRQDTGLQEMMRPFQTNYGNVVKVMFLKELYIALWSLLFVIPGIIKAYQYYFVPYLLAENDTLSIGEAIALSKKMTDGEKWNIFVFELSFFGWYLLGAMLGGVGVLFVDPYRYCATAELYTCLKERNNIYI